MIDPVTFLREFHKDYLNNFVSVGTMASYYGITRETCEKMIEEGKKYNELLGMI